LVFGSSDYTIGLVDANTLSASLCLTFRRLLLKYDHRIQPLLSILKAHEFPPTTVCFDTTSTLVVSGSADSSVRIVSIPSDLRGACACLLSILLRDVKKESTAWWTVIMIVIALLVVLLALLAQPVIRTWLKL
jgi:prolactin regulatory element-binding protein